MSSISVNPKPRGRPKTTGKGTLVGVRLQPTELTALDSFIASLPEPRPTRPEAIRRLLEQVWLAFASDRAKGQA